MKREFLNNLGLDKETVNSIMAEYGRSTQAYRENRENIESLTDQVQEAKDEAAQAKLQLNQLKDQYGDYDELKEKYEAVNAELSAQKTNHAIESALYEAGVTDMDYMKFKLGEVSLDRLDAEVVKLKSEYPKFFQAEEQSHPQVQKGYQIMDNKLKEGETPHQWTKESILAIKDDREREKQIAKHIELF